METRPIEVPQANCSKKKKFSSFSELLEVARKENKNDCDDTRKPQNSEGLEDEKTAEFFESQEEGMPCSQTLKDKKWVHLMV